MHERSEKCEEDHVNYGRRVARAVQDEDWQTFRAKLKGLDTGTKLAELEAYCDLTVHNFDKDEHELPHRDCDVCIRVDNYLKALARGGQLHPGVSLRQAFELGDITLLPIRK